MIDWEKIRAKKDTIQTSVENDLTSFNLTDEETAIIMQLPDDYVQTVKELLSRYTPLDTPYNLRDRIVYKAIVQFFKHIDDYKSVINIGYEGQNI